MKYNLLPLTGMVELSPREQLVFEQWKMNVSESYALAGFTPLETPALERAEILRAKAGGETEKQIYQFTKGDTELALRFDLTVPLARYVANYQNELWFPFKRQALARVYRGERAQKGRYREFYQADADVVGRGHLDGKYDAEIIALAVTTIKKLGLGQVIIRINNRKLIAGFLAQFKLLDEQAVIELLDKTEKMSATKMRAELSLLRLDALEIRQIMKFANIRGDWETVYQQLQLLNLNNELFAQGIAELAQLAACLPALGLAPTEYQFDCAIIRGLDYYTGTIFETQLVAAPQLGSICSGGRYDNLVGQLARAQFPGVGLSIGLTRLFSQARELGLIQCQRQTTSQLLVIALTDHWSQVLSMVTTCRQEGIATDLNLQTFSLAKQLAYANKLGCPWVMIIGDDELTANKVQLKNMVTGAARQLSLRQAIDAIRTESISS